MKKLVFAFVLAVSMVLTSCDGGCDMESVDLMNPEVHVYNLYRSSNRLDCTTLYVYKYETPDAYIYRYRISGKTENVDIVPKNKTKQISQDTVSILDKNTYFDF